MKVHLPFINVFYVFFKALKLSSFYYGGQNSLSQHKYECNSEHSDVFRVRSSCSCEIETCKTGQFLEMKVVRFVINLLLCYKSHILL